MDFIQPFIKTKCGMIIQLSKVLFIGPNHNRNNKNYPWTINFEGESSKDLNINNELKKELDRILEKIDKDTSLIKIFTDE